MKKYLFVFLVALAGIFSESFADQLYFTSPVNGHTYYIPAGQSTMDIQVSWVFQSDSSGYLLTLHTDAGSVDNPTSPYIVHNVSPGSKSWWINITYPQGSESSTAVTFTVELTTINITADNNFTDNSGNGTHGQIKVDGSMETAPYPFPRNNGDNVVLQAVTDQTDNQGCQRIWHSGSYNPSERQVAGVNKSPNQTYSFSVSSGDNGKTYQAQLRQVRITTSGTMSSDEHWFTNVTLNGPNDVIVPPGITLYLTSDAVVNLNGHSIISNGGTIADNGSTVNGLRARLTAGATLRGICGTIQAAANYANEENEIYLEDGNFNI